MPLTVILFLHILNVGLTASDVTNDTQPCGIYDSSLKDYKFVGCYESFVPDHIGDIFIINGTTNEDCVQTCLDRGRRFAGIETNTKCRCTETIDTFESNNLEYESMPYCDVALKSLLFHSDYILNTTVCGLLGVQLQDHCSDLNQTQQCAKFCKHYPHFIVLNDTVTGEVSCGCSNESISNIAAPIVIMYSSSDETPCTQETIHILHLELKHVEIRNTKEVGGLTENKKLSVETIMTGLCISHSFYGCYDPFPNITFGFTKDNISTQECLEFCTHIEKPFAGIEHRNHCRCADDPNIFQNSISYHANCSLTKGATLYYLSFYEITNQCNDTSLNCSGIAITTNCTYLCQRFPNTTLVPAVSTTSEQEMCDCSESANKTKEVLPSTDIENCTYIVMHIYKKTTLNLPKTTTSLETVITTTETLSDTSTDTIVLSFTNTPDPLTLNVQETTRRLADATTLNTVTNYSDNSNIISTTDGSGDTTDTLTSNQGTSQCICPCTPVSTKWDYLENLNLTRDQLVIYLEDELESLRRDLTIDAKETSAFKNTKISAADSRQSSAAMGGLGVVLLTVIFGLIVLSDFTEFIRRRSWTPKKHSP